MFEFDFSTNNKEFVDLKTPLKCYQRIKIGYWSAHCPWCLNRYISTKLSHWGVFCCNKCKKIWKENHHYTMFCLQTGNYFAPVPCGGTGNLEYIISDFKFITVPPLK